MTSKKEKLWDTTSVVKLLAWLDFCKESAIDFESSITDLLVTETGKEFAISQVRNKLQSFWRGTRQQRNFKGDPKRPDHTLWKQIIEEGTSDLPNLDQSIRAATKQLLREYQASRSKFELHYKSKIPLTTASPESIDLTNDVPKATRNSKPKKRPNKMDHQIPNKRKKTTEPRETSNIQNLIEIPEKVLSDSKGRKAVSQPTTKKGQRDPDQNSVGQATKPLETSSPANTNHAAANNTTINHDVSTIKQMCWKEIQHKELEIARLLIQWHRETEDLVQEQEKLKATIEEKEALLHNRNLAWNDRLIPDNDWLIDRLYEQKQEISRLTKHIHDIEEGATFAKKDPRHDKHSIMEAIDTAMKQIESELDSIMCGHSSPTKLSVPRVPKQSDLGSLAQSIFGAESDIERHLMTCMAKYDQELIIRVFVLAALKEWVFLTGSPDFSARDNRVLNAYRQEVMNQGGWKQLRNLDLAAFQRLLRETSHGNCKIPRTAANLAARLSRTLMPFFPIDPSSTTPTDFETWGEDTAVWEDRRDCFIRIFEIALKLKAATLITDFRYTFIVFQPGATTSRIESSGLIPIPESRDSQQSLNNILWKLASVDVYEAPSSGRERSMADALVEPKNFIPSQSTREFFYSKAILMSRESDGRQAPNSEKTPNAMRLGLLTSTEHAIAYMPSCSTNISAGSHTIPPSISRQESDQGQATAQKGRRDNRQSVEIVSQDGNGGVSDSEESTGDHEGDKNLAKGSHQQGGIIRDPAARLVCSNCGAKYASQGFFARHLAKNSCGRCAQCDKGFIRLRDLQKHQRLEHDQYYEDDLEDEGKTESEAAENLTCKACGREFTRKCSLTVHKRKGSCPWWAKCEMLFPNIETQRKHTEEEHGQLSRPTSIRSYLRQSIIGEPKESEPTPEPSKEAEEICIATSIENSESTDCDSNENSIQPQEQSKDDPSSQTDGEDMPEEQMSCDDSLASEEGEDVGSTNLQNPLYCQFCGGGLLSIEALQRHTETCRYMSGTHVATFEELEHELNPHQPEIVEDTAFPQGADGYWNTDEGDRSRYVRSRSLSISERSIGGANFELRSPGFSSSSQTDDSGTDVESIERDMLAGGSASIMQRYVPIGDNFVSFEADGEVIEGAERQNLHTADNLMTIHQNGRTLRQGHSQGYQNIRMSDIRLESGRNGTLGPMTLEMNVPPNFLARAMYAIFSGRT